VEQQLSPSGGAGLEGNWGSDSKVGGDSDGDGDGNEE